MNETEDARIRNLLKQALHPASHQLQHDLWPQMLQRLDKRSPVHEVPWFDWALLTVLVITILAFPHSILMLLYHL